MSAGAARGAAVSPVQIEARPPSPYRLPRSGGEDRVMRIDGGVAARLLHVAGSPVLVRAWQPDRARVAIRAEAVDPDSIAVPLPLAGVASATASPEQLEIAAQRMRFALGVDDDLSEFHRRFRRDALIGPLLSRRPHFRPHRRPWPWEALAWAVVKQLIESDRAARIQRRIVGRWGPRMGEARAALRDVPGAAEIAGRAPAELESMDLSPRRALALRAVARAIAAGHCDPSDPAGDRRLLATPEIGPWTVQCLALFGRGDLDALPAGDLAYIKLVGRLAHLGRRATVGEVEEFYAPYAPFRGLVGTLTLAGLHRAVAQGPPLRFAA
jgi:3-methyladenine DNA glycosylase/8-oxoguanine DNA glycosylase